MGNGQQTPLGLIIGVGAGILLIASIIIGIVSDISIFSLLW